jgi:putative protease
MPEKEVGFVEHWFSNVMVAGIKITNGPLKVGDKIHIKGHTSDFTCTVESMQVEHGAIEEAKNGDDIGIKVPEHAREHDKVYLVTE